jgi:hypothetical protein
MPGRMAGWRMPSAQLSTHHLSRCILGCTVSCSMLPPPRRRSTRCSVDSFWMLQSARVRPSSSCLPAKIRRCWSGGMPA